MAKYDVLVGIYQGVLQDVEILSHEAAAEKWARWAKKHHYKDYEDFLKALNEHGVDEELRWFPEVETQVGENEIVHRTLNVNMKGKLKDINSFCGAVGELSNTYDLDCDFI